MGSDKCIKCDAPLIGHCREYFDGEGNFVGRVHEECFQAMVAPKTYEQGREDGLREAFLASCNAVCPQCEQGMRFAHGWHIDPEDGQYLTCSANGIRRAAREQFGVELEEK